MYMESPIVRARELRRLDLLEDAARHRNAGSAMMNGTGSREPVAWPRWSPQIGLALGKFAARLRPPLPSAVADGSTAG